MRKCRSNAMVGSRAALAAAVLLGSPVAGASPIAAGVLAHYLATYVATTIRPVTSCADDGSAGTLRATIALAGSGDTIDLSGLPGADARCTDSTITLAQGEIAIPNNMTLLGPSDATLTIAAGGQNRVLNSTSTDLPNAYLQVASLTITGGSNYTDGRGGCIRATGEVRLDHATVTSCIAYTYGSHSKYLAVAIGGGVYANSVSMTNGSVVSDNIVKRGPYTAHLYGAGVFTNTDFACTDSTISGNFVFGSGGAIAAYGNITLTRCTLDGNAAAKYGGGVFAANPSAHVEVDQSTISGNAAGKGGGIYTKAPATIANSTIAFNTAAQSYGGGIQSKENVAMLGSIVARNNNANATIADIVLGSGKTLTGSNNLVMTATVYPPGVIVTTSDPLLAPLGNHGGLTRTHALLSGSPAIDAGKNSNAYATDQRGVGFAREVPTGMPDMGAYERQSDEDEIFGNGFD